MIIIAHLKRSGGHLLCDYISGNTDLNHINWYNHFNQHMLFNKKDIKKIKRGNSIINFEDLKINDFFLYLENILFEIKTVLLIRSPKNLLASRIRSFTIFPDYKEIRKTNIVDFITYEKELILNYYDLKNLNIFDIIVDYDEFIENKEYRIKIIKKITQKKQNINDGFINKINKRYGGGSSFTNSSNPLNNTIDRTKFLNEFEKKELDKILSNEMINNYKIIKNKII